MKRSKSTPTSGTFSPNLRKKAPSPYTLSMRHVLVGIGIAMVCGGQMARATVLVPVSFREAVVDATMIVRGHVTDVRGVFSASGAESIVTVAVDQRLKGDADDFVSVHVPGGTVGRYRYVFVGAPTFAVNDQAVFLLKRGSDSALRLVGLSQGVYRLQALTAGGPAVVAAPVVAGQTASVGDVVRGDSRRKMLSVSEFESLIRLVVAGQSAGGAR